MIEAGADMELRDEQGYSALECAVYRGDTATQLVVEQGLKKKKFLEQYQKAQTDAPNGKSINLLLTPEKKLDRLRYEATIRTGYRQLFQYTLRPVLLQAQDTSDRDQLRNEYASHLKYDEGEDFD
jgi:ankyrin repeat protein